MRSMCRPVSASRHSTATPSRWTISTWVSRELAVRSRTRRSSSSLSRRRRAGGRGSRRARSRRSRRRRADQERHERRGHVDDQLPASKASWAADQEARAGDERTAARRAQREAQRASGASSASSASSSRSTPARRRAQRQRRAARSRSRSPGPRRPAISCVAADRRRVDVAQRRRGGADHDDAGRGQARGRSARRRRRRTRRCGIVPGRAAVVDPGAAVAEAVARAAGAAARRAVDDGDAVEPADARGKRAIAPLVSLWRSEAAARASTRRRLASPPRTSVWPSAVALAGGEHGAAGVADRVDRARGPRAAVVGSVNWTS